MDSDIDQCDSSTYVLVGLSFPFVENSGSSAWLRHIHLGVQLSEALSITDPSIIDRGFRGLSVSNIAQDDFFLKHFYNKAQKSRNFKKIFQ